jgi:accessory gene regulator protein AgrB
MGIAKLEQVKGLSLERKKKKKKMMMMMMMMMTTATIKFCLWH